MNISISTAWLCAILQVLTTWAVIYLPFGMRVDIAIDRTIAIVFLMLALTIVALPRRQKGWGPASRQEE